MIKCKQTKPFWQLNGINENRFPVYQSRRVLQNCTEKKPYERNNDLYNS